MPDGKQIIFSANRPGHATRCFVQNLDGGTPRPVTPEGVNNCQISPDGELVLGTDLAGNGALLYPMDGQPPRPIPGLLPGETLVWTSDPRFLYAYQWKQPPVRIYRLNLQNGQRQFLKELNPTDVTGLCAMSHILFSSDGRTYIYGYVRMLSELYLVKGLQ